MLSGVSGPVSRITMQQSENMVQSPNAVSMWGSVENCGSTLKQCWASLIVDWPSLKQQWAATLAQHWTGIRLVGLHPLYDVHRRQVLNGWPTPAMVVEGIGLHVEDIFQLLGSFLNKRCNGWTSGIWWSLMSYMYLKELPLDYQRPTFYSCASCRNIIRHFVLHA